MSLISVQQIALDNNVFATLSVASVALVEVTNLGFF